MKSLEWVGVKQKNSYWERDQQLPALSSCNFHNNEGSLCETHAFLQICVVSFFILCFGYADGKNIGLQFLSLHLFGVKWLRVILLLQNVCCDVLLYDCDQRLHRMAGNQRRAFWKCLKYFLLTLLGISWFMFLLTVSSELKELMSIICKTGSVYGIEQCIGDRVVWSEVLGWIQQL